MNIVSVSYDHPDHQGNDFDIFLGFLNLNFSIIWMPRTSFTFCWKWQTDLALKNAATVDGRAKCHLGWASECYIKRVRKMSIPQSSTLEVVLSKLASKTKIGLWTRTRYFLLSTTCSVTAQQDARSTYVTATPTSVHIGKIFISLQFS